MKLLLFLTLITWFMGSAFLSIDLGPFALFPARIFIFILWAIIIIRGVRLKKINYSHIRIKSYLLFLMAWFLWAVFSVLWADSLIDVIRHCLFIFSGVSLILFVVWYLHDIVDYRRFVVLWLIALIPILALGYWNLFTGNYLENALTRGIIHGSNLYFPTALFGNTNDLATYLALSIPFLLIPMSYIRNKYSIIFGIPLLLLTAYLLFMTSSRANYIALIMGIIFWFFFLLRPLEKSKVIALATLLLVMLGVGYSSEIQELGANISEQILSVGVQIKNQEESAYVRTNLIKNSLIMLVDSSLIGVGAGNVEYHMEKFGTYYTAGITNPHNWWIELLVNYGLIFFIAYIIFYLKMFQSLWRLRKFTREKWRLILLDIALTGMIIFIMASVSSSSIIAFYPQYIFWAFCLGVINCCRNDLIIDTASIKVGGTM